MRHWNSTRPFFRRRSSSSLGHAIHAVVTPRNFFALRVAVFGSIRPHTSAGVCIGGTLFQPACKLEPRTRTQPMSRHGLPRVRISTLCYAYRSRHPVCNRHRNGIYVTSGRVASLRRVALRCVASRRAPVHTLCVSTKLRNAARALFAGQRVDLKLIYANWRCTSN